MDKEVWIVLISAERTSTYFFYNEDKALEFVHLTNMNAVGSWGRASIAYTGTIRPYENKESHG